ncbi:MAG TPA: class F sortase [Acidimicrobiia bacterium]
MAHQERHWSGVVAVAPAVLCVLLVSCSSATPSTELTQPAEVVTLTTKTTIVTTTAPVTSVAAVTVLEATPSEGIGVPARVIVPSVEIDARVVGVGLQKDGAMETPDFGLAGWYRLGPRPGESGPAVIVAHVDSVAGPDVFNRLDELTAGVEIVVEDAFGGRARFVVRDTETVPKSELPVERIWSDDDDPVLRLITCGGEFDRTVRSYESNVIVYADAVVPSVFFP